MLGRVLKIGEKFGKRIVIKGPIKDHHARRKYLVRCKCGSERWLLVQNIIITKQCVKCNRGSEGRTWKQPKRGER